MVVLIHIREQTLMIMAAAPANPPSTALFAAPNSIAQITLIASTLSFCMLRTWSPKIPISDFPRTFNEIDLAQTLFIVRNNFTSIEMEH